MSLKTRVAHKCSECGDGTALPVGVKPRLMDLFCGAGGAAMGYHRAGFDVIGFDIKPQPNYPFKFVQQDAMEVLRDLAGDWYNTTYPFAIHASPPCQAFTQMSARWRGKGGKADGHVDLLTPTRALLAEVSVPWVIENVQGARNHMKTTLSLHGGQFGLGVYRPRLFETNTMLFSPGKAPRPPFPVGVYGTKPDGRTTYRYRNNGNMKGKSLIRAARSIEEARAVMGIDWMDWDEIKEAIPPAYTEWIGRQLIVSAEARLLGSDIRVAPFRLPA